MSCVALLCYVMLCYFMMYVMLFHAFYDTYVILGYTVSCHVVSLYYLIVKSKLKSIFVKILGHILVKSLYWSFDYASIDQYVGADSHYSFNKCSQLAPNIWFIVDVSAELRLCTNSPYHTGQPPSCCMYYL